MVRRSGVPQLYSSSGYCELVRGRFRPRRVVAGSEFFIELGPGGAYD